MGSVRYDLDRAELWRGDSLIRLTATEAQLMRLFAAAAGTPVPREKLAGDLPKETGGGQERAVDVQITRLRRKIEDDPRQPRYLQTVRGEGYMLQPD
jgi:two-component system phosphate regulon response regulator OmpR